MTTVYGLPEDVRFCVRCTMSNQRPGSTVTHTQTADTPRPGLFFNADGVCAACEYQEVMDTQIDWEQREQELRDLCSQYRSAAGNYDVIVPGSGGKDSCFVAHYLESRFDMHPLTTTWAPMMYTDVGWRNMQRWRERFTNILVQPKRSVHRLLTRLAFEVASFLFAPFVTGQRQIGARLSVEKGVPFICYGEAPAQYSGPIAENYESRMDPKFFAGEQDAETIVLGGVPGKELMSKHGLGACDLRPYLPTPLEQLQRVGTDFRYLGYFVQFKPEDVYYYAQKHLGFECNDRRTEGSFSKYSSIDDKMDPLHYTATLAMFGIGRATYDSSQQIRTGFIDRDEGVALVKQYDHEIPRRYLAECLEYMGITERAFWERLDRARPDHLWERVDGEWRLRHAVYHEAQS